MKMLLWLVLILVFVQVAYTAYYFSKSRTLNKKTYIGKKELGDRKNPEFRLYVGGDSVGAGVGATSFEKTVSGRLARYLADTRFVVFQNDSVVGTKMWDLATRPLPQGKWDLAVLLVSSNDLFRFSNIIEFRKATEKVLDGYLQISDKVIVVGPGRVFDAPPIPIVLRPVYRWRANDYVKILNKEVGKRKNVFYINPVNPPSGVVPVENWESPDKFHPGDEGQKYWFEMIKTAL